MIEDLHIKATKTHPEIFFSEAGELRISGRMINDDLIDFFRPLIRWAEKAKCECIYIDIDLEYINTSGIFLLVKLLNTFEANTCIKQIIINWQFEEDDEEHYDTGCLIKDSLKRSDISFQSKICYECLSDEKYMLFK